MGDMAQNKADYIYEIPIDKSHSKEIHRCRFKLTHLKKDERMTIFGLTGTGKSYLADKIMKYQSRSRLVVLLDTKLEYNYPELTEELLLNKKSKGLYRCFELDYYNHKIENPRTICEFLACNLFKRGNCLFIVEEISEVVPKTNLPLIDKKVMPYLGKYITQGRKFNCGFIGLSQRPAETHITIPSQSNHIISFFMSMPHDVKYLKRWFPEDIYGKFIKRKEDKISHEFVRFYVNTQGTFHHFRYYPRAKKSSETAKKPE